MTGWERIRLQRTFYGYHLQTPFLVPANINLTINAKADQVKYDKVNYNNINGTLVLNDETVKLQNVKTEALDGTIAFNGSYSTKTNKKEPAISYQL